MARCIRKMNHDLGGESAVCLLVNSRRISRNRHQQGRRIREFLTDGRVTYSETGGPSLVTPTMLARQAFIRVRM